MAVMGRPKKEIVKDKRITLRLTESEYNKLNEHAKRKKLTVSKAIYEEIKHIFG